MFMDIAARVVAKHLTYLSYDKLSSMSSQLQWIKANDVPGDFLEFGLALGGSGLCIASELDRGRRFIGFDVFGMIPPPGEKDGPAPLERYGTIKAGRSEGIAGDTYYGYMNDLKGQVIRNFGSFGLNVDGDRISFVEGLYEDTLPGRAQSPIAFAHIDCDWFDPVMLCLQYVAPNLSPGGVIILDDYNDWPGCRNATDDFLSGHPELQMQTNAAHCVLMKVA